MRGLMAADEDAASGRRRATGRAAQEQPSGPDMACARSRTAQGTHPAPVRDDPHPTPLGADHMAVNDLQELLKHELGDLLFAEKTILKGLKQMSREVSDPDMRQRMEAHQGETEQQIQNIERAFESMGLKAE